MKRRSALTLMVSGLLGFCPSGFCTEVASSTQTDAADGQKLVLATIDGAPSLTEGPERVLREAYRRAGIAIEVRVLPLLRSVDQANRGQIDGEIARFPAYEDSAPEMLRVPTPVIEHFDYVPYVLNKVPAQDLSSTEAMARSGLRIGVRHGVLVVDRTALKDHISDRPPTYPALFLMLLSKRIDVAVAPRGEFAPWQASLPEPVRRASEQIQALPPVISQSAYHYLHKRHAALVPVIDRQLKAMKKDGSLDRILQSTAAPN